MLVMQTGPGEGRFVLARAGWRSQGAECTGDDDARESLVRMLHLPASTAMGDAVEC